MRARIPEEVFMTERLSPRSKNTHQRPSPSSTAPPTPPRRNRRREWPVLFGDVGGTEGAHVGVISPTPSRQRALLSASVTAPPPAGKLVRKHQREGKERQQFLAGILRSPGTFPLKLPEKKPTLNSS